MTSQYPGCRGLWSCAGETSARGGSRGPPCVTGWLHSGYRIRAPRRATVLPRGRLNRRGPVNSRELLDQVTELGEGEAPVRLGGAPVARSRLPWARGARRPVLLRHRDRNRPTHDSRRGITSGLSVRRGRSDYSASHGSRWPARRRSAASRAQDELGVGVVDQRLRAGAAPCAPRFGTDRPGIRNAVPPIGGPAVRADLDPGHELTEGKYRIGSIRAVSGHFRTTSGAPGRAWECQPRTAFSAVICARCLKNPNPRSTPAPPLPAAVAPS